MNNSEIIAGLRELAEERRTWFREDGDDEQFRRDYSVLMEAAERLEKDAVPVVRCKDCHYVSEYDEYIRDKDEIAHGLWCLLKNHSCEPDDYCSCGYREATT